MHPGYLRSILLALAFVPLAQAMAQNKHYRIGPPPKWVLEQPLGGARVADKACLKGGDEILLLDRQYNLATQQVYWRRADRLTSAQGIQNGSRIEVGFDPTFQRMTFHHLRIVRDGRVIDKLDPGQLRVLHREEDMSSYLYDGTLTIVADLKDVRIGDIVDYSISITGWNPVDGGRFQHHLSMGFSVPVARMFTRIIAPAGRTPTIRHHLFEQQPEVRTSPLGTETSWLLGPIACIQVDDGTPGWYDPYPSIEVSEFGDVEDVRRWALEQYAVDRRITGALARHVDEIKKLPDVMQRIDSAVHLVQRDVRYLGLEEGISAYRPHPPVQVYDQRFGDCKDKSLLLVTVLDAMGVKAYPALVNTRNGRSLEEHLPRPALFDHCIAVIPIEGDTLWVDATSTHNGGSGTNRYTPDYGKALVVGQGFTGFTRMHVNDTGIVNVVERIRLDTLGAGADVVIETKYGGRRADGARAEFASQSLADIGKGYADFYAGIYGVCIPAEPLRYTDDPVANVFTTIEHYHVAEAWDTLADRGVVAFNTVAYYVRDHQVKPGIAQRSAPFRIGAPLRLRHVIEVTLPEDWNLRPFSFAKEGFGITYSSEVMVKSPREVVLDYTYTSSWTHIEADQATAFQELQGEIADDIYYEVTMGVAGLEGASRPDPWGKWLFILSSIAVCVFGAIRLYRYDPKPHIDSLGRPHQGIGSFLLLPVIGLCLSPLRIIYQMFADDGAFFDATDYTGLVSTEHPVWIDLAMHLSQLAGFMQLALTILLLVLYLQRRSSVPLLMKVLFIGSLAWLCIDFWIYEAMDFETVLGEPYGTREIIRAFIVAAIWVPVFHFSERVKLTFTRQLHRVPLAPPPFRPQPTEQGPHVPL